MNNIIKKILQYKIFFESVSWVFFYFILLMFGAYTMKFRVTGLPFESFKPFIMMLRWDTWSYLEIAQNGYNISLVNCFPLYSLLLKICSLIFNDLVFSGYFLSFMLMIAGLFFYLKINGDKDNRSRSTALLLFWPGSIFLVMIYSESLFFFLSTAFFWVLFQKKWLLAATLGFLASLTKIFGIFLFPVYIIFYLYSSGWTIKNIFYNFKEAFFKKEILYSFLIFLGPLLFFLFLKFKFGDFWLFFNNQISRDWEITWPFKNIVVYADRIFIKKVWQLNFFGFFNSVFAELGSYILLFLATIYWFLKKNWAFFIYCFMYACFFACISPIVSLNRYLIFIFPVFIFLSELFKKKSRFLYFCLAIFIIWLASDLDKWIGGFWVG